FRVFWRRGWIVALSTALTASSALLFSVVQTPVYQSTVDVLVQPARTDFGLTQSAKLLLDSYVAFLDTETSAAEVIDMLQLDTLPKTLRGDVRIAAEAQRFLIHIEVENENGDLANDVARHWAQLLVQWRNDENQKQRREDRVTAIVLDDPRYVLDHPRKGINTAAGAVLGLLIGAALVLVLEYLDAGIVRTHKDVERFLGMSVLGAIPAHGGEASLRRM
ncbi:MAG: Wzz/FepE/Etk N-terminal domain-containing protein, partial [Anaerolineales bacterium]|nr:Wzz/FepE/Etk N-terminal domain-containing protein [Anaerolineales bacterium]